MRDFAARRGIVLATGSRPRMLPGLEPDGRRVVTSDDALFAPGLPARALVLGGGAIGVEYASLHRSMGAEVTGGQVLGVHLVGPDVARHIHPHPTLPEAVGGTFPTLAGRGPHPQ